MIKFCQVTHIGGATKRYHPTQKVQGATELRQCGHGPTLAYSSGLSKTVLNMHKSLAVSIFNIDKAGGVHVRNTSTNIMHLHLNFTFVNLI